MLVPSLGTEWRPGHPERMEGVPGLPGAPQDEAGLTRKFETAAQQAPPSLEFSKQEHWSGLPFPSPMHKSEK